MAQQPELKIVYVDRPEVFETFADSVEKISVDGQVWRIEFCVTRLDEPKPPVIPGKKYPSCRLVLTAKAGLELHDKLKGLVAIMEKQGLVKQQSVPDITIPPGTKPN